MCVQEEHVLEIRGVKCETFPVMEKASGVWQLENCGEY